MRVYDLDGIDLRLPQFIVSQQVSSRIQSGQARLMILPFRPQPSVVGMDDVSDGELLGGVRRAFNMGLIQPPIAPIRIGYAFELKSEYVPEKCHKFGTGIVDKMGITRLSNITAKHWRLCGYPAREDFNAYWEQAAAGLSEHKNPWCWLIEFTFKE